MRFQALLIAVGARKWYRLTAECDFLLVFYGDLTRSLRHFWDYVAKYNKKHLKKVGPIHHYDPPHANSPDVASGTVVRRLHIDVHDANDKDNAWQRGPLWPHGMGPIMSENRHS